MSQGSLTCDRAPRRILVVARADHGRWRDIRHTGGQEPVGGCFQTDVESPGDKLLTDKFKQGDMQLLVTVTRADGVKSSAARPVAPRHRRPPQAVPARRRRDLAVDPCRHRPPLAVMLTMSDRAHPPLIQRGGLGGTVHGEVTSATCGTA